MGFPPVLRNPSLWLWGLIATGAISQLVIGLYSHQSMAPSFLVLAVGVIGLARHRLGRWVGLDPLTLAALAVLTLIMLAQPLIAPDCARCAKRALRLLPMLWLIALTAAAAQAVFSAAPACAARWFRMITWGGGLLIVLMLIELLADAAVYRWVTNFPPDQAVGLSRYNRAASLLALVIWSWAVWITLRPGRGSFAPFWLAAALAGLSGVLALGDSTTSLLAFALGLVAAAWRRRRRAGCCWRARSPKSRFSRRGHRHGRPGRRG